MQSDLRSSHPGLRSADETSCGQPTRSTLTWSFSTSLSDSILRSLRPYARDEATFPAVRDWTRIVCPYSSQSTSAGVTQDKHLGCEHG